MKTTKTAEFGAQVADLVERMFDDYRSYCLGEDADAEGYVARLEAQLEGLREGAQPDPVAAEAIPAVLLRIEAEDDGIIP